MLSLDEKRRQAPAALVLAVDLVCECIKSASRRVSNSRLESVIRRMLDDNKRKLTRTIRFRVRNDAVDVFDGAPKEDHAHIAISQATGETFYWRNRGEQSVVGRGTSIDKVR